MAKNSQLSTTGSKRTTQTSRTGTESQICRAFGGLSARRRNEEKEEKMQGSKSPNWGEFQPRWGCR